MRIYGFVLWQVCPLPDIFNKQQQPTIVIIIHYRDLHKALG